MRWISHCSIKLLLLCVFCFHSLNGEADDKDKCLSILFVGDIMLDGGPGHVVASGQDPFRHCATVLRDADFTIGNLECVLGSSGKQLLKSYTFRAATDSPKFLKPYFSGLSLANNHSGDFGPDGLTEELRILESEGIPYFGGGRTLSDARKPLLLEKHGFKIALLGYNGFRAENYAATDANAGSAPLIQSMVLEDIRAARMKADFVIPFVHWGPELTAAPYKSQSGFAKQMIEAGAAAVIGAHPHVTQTVEVYRGSPIVYSLGNFAFDYFPVDPPEWIGWGARLTLRKNAPTDLEMHTFRLDPAGIPHPLVEEDDPGILEKPMK